MTREPEWTKRFSNDTVCNYYYYLSIAILVIGAINLFFLVSVLMSATKMRGYLTGVLIGQLITLGIGYFVYLFAYLTCTRALNK